MGYYEELYCLKYRPDERKREDLKRHLLHQAAQSRQLNAKPFHIRVIRPLARLASIIKGTSRHEETAHGTAANGSGRPEITRESG